MFQLTHTYTHTYDEHPCQLWKASLYSTVTPTSHLPLLPGNILVCFLASHVRVHFLEFYVNGKTSGHLFLCLFFT